MSAVTSSSISMVDYLAFHGKSSEQQVVANGIDQARDALGAEVDFLEHRG